MPQPFWSEGGDTQRSQAEGAGMRDAHLVICPLCEMHQRQPHLSLGYLDRISLLRHVRGHSIDLAGVSGGEGGCRDPV